MRKTIYDEDLMNAAAVEHATARMLIDQLENIGTDDPNYYAITVLGEYVRHHLKKAKINLVVLGARMRARREERR